MECFHHLYAILTLHPDVTNNYVLDEFEFVKTQDRSEEAWRAALLGWLTFAEIDDRREQVEEAHEKTFGWIFEEEHESRFADWLRSGDGIYWVHGKPASGKSTLLKFITREPRLHTLLEIWTAGIPLTFASFWFWVSGSPLQRSLVGLLRTLLHQMLRTNDRLCRVAFPDWQLRFGTAVPTLSMMTAAMKNVLASDALSTNFFFIIDGLDEYERDGVGKTELANLFLKMTKSSRVKLLISSRPENQFRTAFMRCPTLQLETLTKTDISVYVNTGLWSNPLLRKITDLEERGIRDIENFILKNANGVFLWVALVLKIALDDINNHEDLMTIRNRVTELPPELDDIFTHIMQHRIPQHCKQEACRCLLIVLGWNTDRVSHVNLGERSLILDDTTVAMAQLASNYEKACELAAYDEELVTEAKLQFRRRLATRCQGLIECQSKGMTAYGYTLKNPEILDDAEDQMQVTVLHRTLLDYLNEGDRAQLLLGPDAGDKFDVNTAVMAGLICRGWKGIGEATGFFTVDATDLPQTFFRFNVLAEASTGQHRSELIAMFDRNVPVRLRPLDPISETDDWWNNMINPSLRQLRPAPDLLAFVVYTGASKHLAEAIRTGQVYHPERLSYLLLFALAPYFVFAADLNLVVPDINFDALINLVENGADPAYTSNGLCPWNLALIRATHLLEGRSYAVLLPGATAEDHLHNACTALRLLLIFARYAPDLQKCHDMHVLQDAPALDSSSAVNTSVALQEFLLQQRCCFFRIIQSCQCHKAKTIRPLALELLGLMETCNEGRLEGDAHKPERPKTRRLCIPDFKQMFLQRR